MSDKFWTEERGERCRRLWADGLSATEIATEIGAPSRNSVLSKIHRSGWSGPNSWTTRTAGTPKRPKVTGSNPGHPNGFKIPRRKPGQKALPPWPIAPASATSTMSFAEDGRPRSLMALGENCCRWPIGDPHHPDFGYCGAPRSPQHESYCINHFRAAYGG